VTNPIANLDSDSVAHVLTKDFDQEYESLVRAIKGKNLMEMEVQLRVSWIVLKGLWAQARVWVNPETGVVYESKRDIPENEKYLVSSKRRWHHQKEFSEHVQEVYGLNTNTWRRRHIVIERMLANKRALYNRENTATDLVDAVKAVMSAFTATDEIRESLVYERTPAGELEVVGVNENVFGETPLEEALEVVERETDNVVARSQGGESTREIMKDVRGSFLRKPLINAYLDTDHQCIGIYVEWPDKEEDEEQWTEKMPTRYYMRIYDEDGTEVTFKMPTEIFSWIRNRLNAS
jgi:hypothetical protein